jgi:hypothetical protein
MPFVISKLTGTIIVTTGSGRRENTSRINVGFSWKGNKPVKQVMNKLENFYANIYSLFLALWLYEKRRSSMVLFGCSSTYYFGLYVTVSIYSIMKMDLFRNYLF